MTRERYKTKTPFNQVMLVEEVINILKRVMVAVLENTKQVINLPGWRNVFVFSSF